MKPADQKGCRCAAAFFMSFSRHSEIYPPMEAQTNPVGAPAHRLDEFPTGHSLAGCSPAEPASASPVGHQYALKSFYRSRIFQRTVNSVLTVCVSRGGNRRADFLSHRRRAGQAVSPPQHRQSEQTFFGRAAQRFHSHQIGRPRHRRA